MEIHEEVGSRDSQIVSACAHCLLAKSLRAIYCRATRIIRIYCAARIIRHKREYVMT